MISKRRRRVLIELAKLALVLLSLSFIGGLAVSPLSQGMKQPAWLGSPTSVWINGPDPYRDSYSILQESTAYWIKSYFKAIEPEHRDIYADIRKEYDQRGQSINASLPEWMSNEMDQGVKLCHRGSVGLFIAMWGWHDHPEDTNSFGFPETGVVRVLRIPFAFEPKFPGILIGLFVGYGLLAAATYSFSRVLRLAKSEKD